MRSKLTAILLILVTALSFTSCAPRPNTKDDGKLSIVTACFPEYDWVRNITKGVENVEITLLVNNGSDMHNYQPTAEDVLKISDCDVLIYVGGESSEWIEGAIANSQNEDLITIDLLNLPDDRLMLEEAEDEEEEEYDEHIWLSLKNAILCCEMISDALCDIDSTNARKYSDNSSEYIAELSQLDEQYEAVTQAAANNTLIFADRFPFAYMAEDYSLVCHSAFPGCSADVEASFETIVSLAELADAEGVNNVLIIDGGNRSFAEVVCETAESDLDILKINSIQSVSMNDIDEGISYLDIMKSNLEVLEAALDGTN